ncbi:eukaryotic translation initiation factor 4 gamma 3-like [Microplitis mediator]|uniref:eukaryotic translation initiation factor 4 gamma 3-like n=1 Tax=Microplitis mediator TaxID=375433 RepID=UPI002555DA85|nr:eukaryotic translation initiation factor 4 gamma 3-like [Microplitis mediator]
MSLNEGIKLHESTNPWKPTPLKNNETADDEKTLLYKKVRSIFNKVAPQTFDKFVGQLIELEIDTQEKLQGVVNLIYDKAVNEPKFVKAYVMMCRELGPIKVDLPTDETASRSSITFRSLLLNRCQVEFEKNQTDETKERVKELEEIEECTDADKKEELKLSLEEHDRRIRMKSIGNIKIIGELNKQSMLTTNIMKRCVIHLLETPDEGNLERLCELLTIIGQTMEEKEDLSPYFATLTELINRNGKDKIRPRIRFMIQDIIDLRQNRWVPRHGNINSKTMVQTQKKTSFNSSPNRCFDRRRNGRSIFNKVTPQKVDEFVGQLKELEIDTQEKLQGVVNLIYDKAINEPKFVKAYVMMCRELAPIKVDLPTDETASRSSITFRSLLLTRCQEEFEKNQTDETKERVKKLEEIEECTDADKKEELKSSLEEHDRQIKMKSIGNIKIIGELCKQKMLTHNIMYTCINHLLKTPDEGNLERLCELLTIIGKTMEETRDLLPYFTVLIKLINQNEKDKISSRIRLMIQDVIDLKLNRWVPRHIINSKTQRKTSF